jgi:hypothetical protein
MNSILKKILITIGQAAEDTVSNTVPGAGTIIKGVTKLIDKDHTNNAEAIDELEQGLLTAIQSLSPAQVSNASLVLQGVTELKSGFDKIKQGLKK